MTIQHNKPQLPHAAVFTRAKYDTPLPGRSHSSKIHGVFATFTMFSGTTEEIDTGPFFFCRGIEISTIIYLWIKIMN